VVSDREDVGVVESHRVIARDRADVMPKLPKRVRDAGIGARVDQESRRGAAGASAETSLAR
jgi:hypothetical protein